MSSTKITWLASFPKSGNTYLRFLLYHYVFGEMSHSSELAGRIPDLHKLIAKKQTLNLTPNRRLFVKTHFPLQAEHPYLGNMERYVYIIRNPLDTMISNARYFGCGAEDPEKFKQFLAHFIKHTTTQRWLKLGYGTWPNHIASWIGASSDYPSFIIRYEDLRSEPNQTLTQVLGFLGLEIDPERVRIAVDRSSIENLREMEDKEGTSGIFTTAGKENRFVNEGKTGQSIEMIDPTLQKAFERKFGDLMRLFGYR